ncbi:ABC transporter permease [Shimia biformata]|uniref:ABC transporter permease n=1 Tax=Shimia biformata TaxID=1294299 RepID=UPI001950C9C0|nr:FtsX-like permease family protein [Shimia biformata]
MSLRLAARFARRELRGGVTGFRIFLICLCLGVAAIAAIGTVRAGIEAGISAEGATLLGGDAEVEFTYRFASDEERAWMGATALATSEIVDFRSMAVVDRGDEALRGLTQVKAVDDLYPLIGEVGLDPPLPLDQALEGQGGMPGAVMEPVLIAQLRLEIGDRFRLGTQEFVLTAALVDEPDSATAGFGLGPRTLLRTEALADSGLLQPGTLFETRYRLDLPPGTDLAAVSTDALNRFESTGLRWRDSRNGAPGVAEFVERLGAFLVLVGLSGLAVGGIGVSTAVRAYLDSKTEVVAILRTLGADRRTIFLTYFLQIGLLALIGIAAGLLLGGLLPVILGPLLQSLLPIPAIFAIHPAPLAEAAIYGALTAVIFTLWPLARIEHVRAAALFRDGEGSRRLPAARFLVAISVLLGGLLAVASLFSGSWRLTLWTAGGIVGAMLLLALSAAAIRILARSATRLSRTRSTLRWALNSIGGPGEATVPVVLSLGIGLSVLAAVGQIDGNLRRAIAGELPDIAPSYFFVDIQKDQMPGFLERVETDPAVSRIESAPMLRGIITRINDRPATEIAGDHWVLEGDRGVTYAGALPETTTLTSGTWWGADYNGPPQVSFAAEEAAEMGLTLGDSLTVNILGRDITATLTSLREVDFSTAGMGFVMVMNPSALAGAPHSFIATVYAEEQAEAAILRDVAQMFPNVTAIRVRDAINRVADLLGDLASATSYGAAVTLLTGFLVLIGAAATGQARRAYEAAILKTLGATRRRILTSFATRAILLGAGAGGVALLAGIIGGWAVSHYVLETEFAVIWPSALAIIAGGILANLVTALAFSLKPLAASPARVLRARE